MRHEDIVFDPTDDMEVDGGAEISREEEAGTLWLQQAWFNIRNLR